jgi:hypothetical protein
MWRPWLVVPLLAAIAGGAAFATGGEPIAAALLAAGLASASRALAGDSPAALPGTVIAALVAVATLLQLGGDVGRHAIAAGAAAWAIAELARTAADHSPLVAMLPACVAAALDPSFVALVPIAGARLVTAPWQRPRWIVAVPIAGGIACLVAVLACAGPLGALGDAWTGTRAHPIGPGPLAGRLADALGPICAVAALAGLVQVRTARIALAASLVGALLVDLRAGGVGVATISLAALSAGLAVARLAAMIRLPTGQAFTGGLAGVVLLLPPAWSVVERLR